MTEESSAPQQPQDVPRPEDHVHAWGILDVWHPVSMNHPRINPGKTTLVLMRCKSCSLPQTVTLEGIWTLGEVTQGYAQVVSGTRNQDEER